MSPTRRKCSSKDLGRKSAAVEAGGFVTREVAKLSGLTARQVLAMARAGNVGGAEAGPRTKKSPAGPRGGRPRYSFPDLQVLRMARRLQEQGLSFAALVRGFVQLRVQLAAVGVPLSGMMCTFENDRLIASDGERCWDVASGEMRASRAGPEATVARLPVPAPAPASAPGLPAVPAHPFGRERAWPRPATSFGRAAFAQADTWFNRGLDAEESAPSRASSFYLQAIACNPEHVEAMINLGHLCAAERDSQRAAAFFRLATRVDPEHPVAHFNLAVILHDGGACGAAMQAYRKALLLDPNFADAHFNLGTLLASQGHSAEAGTHFSAFRAVTQASPTTPRDGLI